MLLQSRRGSLIQAHFPDLVSAAAQMPRGLVLDGEVVVWSQGRLSFEALQRRASAGGRTAEQLAGALPAHFIAFDVLQLDGRELLTEPYDRRRAALEDLFTEYELTPPWMLCPMTTDVAVAQEWLESWTKVQGVEGLVIKGRSQRYLPSARGWFNIRRRHTTEAIVGGITGTLARPQIFVLGRYDGDGRLRPVGRTVPLRPDATRQVAEHLHPAGLVHPWTGARFSSTWGSREPLDVTLVVPEQGAEVDADTAIDRGAWRHPMRLARLRLDVTVADVPHSVRASHPPPGDPPRDVGISCTSTTALQAVGSIPGQDGGEHGFVGVRRERLLPSLGNRC